MASEARTDEERAEGEQAGPRGRASGGATPPDQGGSPHATPEPPQASNRQLVLASRPRHNLQLLEQEGYAVERDPRTGGVTLIHPKRFSRVEGWFQRLLKGPEILRRPLDRYGSRLWELCDGERTVAQVVEAMEAEFHEAIHPAAGRVQKLLELLVRMGFIELRPPEPEILERLSEAMAGPRRAEGPPKVEGPGVGRTPGPDPPGTEGDQPSKQGSIKDEPQEAPES